MDRASVGCLDFSFSETVCVIPTFFSATFVHRAQRKRHQRQSRRALCKHAHTRTEPSRVRAVVSRSELAELGAAMYVGTWLGLGYQNPTEP